MEDIVVGWFVVGNEAVGYWLEASVVDVIRGSCWCSGEEEEAVGASYM